MMTVAGSLLAGLSALAITAPVGGTAAATTPAAVLASAPATDWERPDPENLMVMDLANGARVVIELAPAFAPVHVGNIRALARAHWYDGTAIERVQDDYVAQWGDPDGEKPLPHDLVWPAPAEFERAANGLHLQQLPYTDTYAGQVGFADGWPVAEQSGRAWLTHCYGMVGVGRDLSPDTGTGAELYAVIGHAPRHLDRNIAVVGRVLAGMDALASLPRGKGDLGFYTQASERLGILRVRLASDLPSADRPALQRLSTDSPSFQAWVQARANRQDSFFVRPAGAVDLCNALPPVRTMPHPRSTDKAAPAPAH